MTPHAMRVFFEIHSGLNREAPGDFQSTKRAYSMMAGIGNSPFVLDIGCGPGGQTMDLAALSASHIVGVDKSISYLTELRRRAARRNIDQRIHAVNADMFELEFREGAFDVVWAEGSIYIIGFERGLKEWKRFIRRGGYIAVTEVTWLKSAAPEELNRFWTEAYPAIQSAQENLKLFEDAGYEMTGHFALPESSWWDQYYGPIEEKLPALRNKYKDDGEALDVIEMEEAEIDLYKKYSDYYSYVFYVARTG
jgi:SAM-dependent methyltransferase